MTERRTFTREETYRKTLSAHHGRRCPSPLLDYTGLSLIYAISKIRIAKSQEIGENLPSTCAEHFRDMQFFKVGQNPFFKQFLLCAKSGKDGLLIGLSTDESYYILAAWDEHGIELWKPGSQVSFARKSPA